MRSNKGSEFVIEISNKKESKIPPTLKSLCFPQYLERVEVEIFSYDKINQSKGLIYIQDYKNLDIDDFGRELKKKYNPSEVQKATWLKPKNITSTSLLLTFKEK